MDRNKFLVGAHLAHCWRSWPKKASPVPMWPMTLLQLRRFLTHRWNFWTKGGGDRRMDIRICPFLAHGFYARSAARAKGRLGGRPRGIPKASEATAIATETLYREGKLSVMQIAKKLNISKNTLYKYLRYRNVAIGSYKPDCIEVANNVYLNMTRIK